MSNSLLKTLSTIFERDLTKLRNEINGYHTESNIWIIDKEIKNSAGNLCLHLTGNLNTFVCAELGDTSYVRDREFEFNGKDVPRETLVTQIDQTIVDVTSTLGQLTEDALYGDYPTLVFKEKMTTEFFLLHLSAHLNYHLGQVNYHRRLLDV